MRSWAAKGYLGDVDAEAVSFDAADGVALQGWLLRGDGAALILCHDSGSTKESLINLAIDLNDRGFSVLLFDFRGYGRSQRERCGICAY